MHVIKTAAVASYIYMVKCMKFYVHLYLLYKAEKPSVCPSDRHAGISAVSASIETGLARNES